VSLPELQAMCLVIVRGRPVTGQLGLQSAKTPQKWPNGSGTIKKAQRDWFRLAQCQFQGKLEFAVQEAAGLL
jgi:hypothetical protein